MNETARQQLIEDNMKLVYYLINMYYPTFVGDEDLVQCGMVGLCKAADKWDDSRSTFSTFASQVILNEIKIEFRRRAKEPSKVSLSTVVHNGDEKLTLESAIIGDEDVNWVDVKGLRDCLVGREVEVFDLLQSGLSQTEIGRKLGVSRQRVGECIRKIKIRWRKLNGD